MELVASQPWPRYRRSIGCRLLIVPSSIRVSVSKQAGSADEDSNYWTKMMSVIRGEIQEYRSELDALTMKRTQMERKLKQVCGVFKRRSSLLGPTDRVPLARLFFLAVEINYPVWLKKGRWGRKREDFQPKHRRLMVHDLHVVSFRTTGCHC